jgi:hypothetical protein
MSTAVTMAVNTAPKCVAAAHTAAMARKLPKKLPDHGAERAPLDLALMLTLLSAPCAEYHLAASHSLPARSQGRGRNDYRVGIKFARLYNVVQE